jgi:peptidoglycan hydrolase-like protein with peptidoglycan-binding domain
MTPFRMRLFFVAFSALATATSINALYLQEAPRHVAGVRTMTPPEPVKTASIEQPATAPAADPAPTQPPPTASIPEPEKPATPAPAQTAAQPEQPQTTTVAVHEPVAPTPRVSPAGPEVLPPPAPIVKSIQRELTSRGYACGRRDGVLSQETRAAIMAYEFDEKLSLTGEASEAVLKSLIFTKAAGLPSKAKGASADRFEQRNEVVGAVQQMLVQFGYISGPADGQLDGRTREAIRKFEEERGMKHPSGHLTERVLLEIVIVSGRPLAASS